MSKFFNLILFFYPWLCAQQPYDALINLGGDCQLAYQMKEHGLREYALPFDWLITPFDSLYKILENRFDGFLDIDNFELVDTGTEEYIRDKKYDTRWIHGFKVEENFLKDYDAIAQKGIRRIERFLRLLIESENPLFIRKRITQEQSRALADLLIVLRGNNNFTLLALDGNETAKEDWHIDNVVNFHLRQPDPYTWKGDPEAWREIFVAMQLPIGSFDKDAVEN